MCVSEKWIIPFPFLHVSGVSAKAQGSGERLGMTFKTQTFHLFLLLCFVLLSLFFFFFENVFCSVFLNGWECHSAFWVAGGKGKAQCSVRSEKVQ